VVGEGAGDVDPEAPRLLAEVPAAGEAVAALAADDVPLGGDQLADLEPLYVAAQGGDVAGELVAHGHGGGDGRPGPVVPLVDVEVGAADARGVHPDQDLVRTGLGYRDLLEGESRAVGMLHQRPHAHLASI